MKTCLPLLVRFWRKVYNVSFATDEDCWLWKGSVDTSGYGQIMDDNKRLQKAHRISWIIYKGPIPEGLIVLHQCDTPACINPSHLRLGTKQDNATDRDTKKRWRKGLGNTKLTNKAVLEIHSLYPKLTQAKLARRFRVDQTTISIVLRDKVRLSQILSS